MRLVLLLTDMKRCPHCQREAEHIFRCPECGHIFCGMCFKSRVNGNGHTCLCPNCSIELGFSVPRCATCQQVIDRLRIIACPTCSGPICRRCFVSIPNSDGTTLKCPHCLPDKQTIIRFPRAWCSAGLTHEGGVA